jgi:serine/threonine-protein kinase RsbW
MHAPLSAQATTTPPSGWSRVFVAIPASVGEARRFVAGILDGRPVADDAVLCISELATNSVLHSDSAQPGGTFTVRAEICDGDYLWIEAEDNGGPWDTHPHDDDRPHGLAIVAALASAWGIDGDDRARVVWARFDWPTPDGGPRQVPS